MQPVGTPQYLGNLEPARESYERLGRHVRIPEGVLAHGDTVERHGYRERGPPFNPGKAQADVTATTFDPEYGNNVTTSASQIVRLNR